MGFGHFFSHIFHKALPFVLDAVATATGNPELIPLIHGGETLAHGGSFGDALKSGGTAFLGMQGAGALGNAFPGTLGRVFGSGGNSLTDLMGTTSGAGSLYGALSGSGKFSDLLPNVSGGFGDFLSGSGGSSGLLGGSGADKISYDYADGLGGYGSVGANGSSSFLPQGFNLQIPSSAGSGVPGAIEGAGMGGGASSFGSGTSGGFGKFSNLLSGVGSLISNSNAEDDLLKAQGKAMGAIKPYAQSGQASNARLSELLGLGGNPSAQGYGTLGTPFSAPDFQADPGYQFRLAEGNKALDRSLGARGSLFSGSALKAGQQYGQGLADSTYNDAYNRWRSGQQDIYNRYSGQSAQGMGAAGGMANLNLMSGNVKANAGTNQSNIINSTLSQLLSGSGKMKLDQYGNPIYG